MKRGTPILILLVALAGVALAVIASLVHDGLSARAKPSALEVALARNTRHLAIPADARAANNPFASTPETLHEARLHFADHCALCHSNEGSGDTMIGRGLYPKPPDLRLPRTQSLSDGELFWIIENGVRFTGMPAFGGTHDSQNDSWKLVLFIRHLPQLTAEERMEMEKMNPKGPDDREEEKDEDDFLDGAPPKKNSETEHHHH